MQSVEHNDLKRELVWECVVYPQPMDYSLYTCIYDQPVSNNTDGMYLENTLGY